jgi:hypothetical protein
MDPINALLGDAANYVQDRLAAEPETAELLQQALSADSKLYVASPLNALHGRATVIITFVATKDVVG